MIEWRTFFFLLCLQFGFVYILAFILCTVWLVVFRKSRSIFEIEIAGIFSVFAIWFCII